MLKFMRKRDSVIVKVILGALAVMFIIFFGSDTLRSMSGSRAGAPADVNGVPVSGQKLAFLVDEKMDDIRKQYPGQPVEQIQAQVADATLAGIINNELFNQGARALGFATTDDELKTFIRKHPQFQNNGKFDGAAYLDRFVPWYQQTRGTSFENDMREELATQKLMSAFDNLIRPTEERLRASHKIENTTYKFSVIKIRTKPSSLDNVLPKDLDASKTAEETGLKNQKELADKIYSLWKSGQDVDAVLKDNKLKIRDIPGIDATGLASVFDGSENIDAMKQLLALGKDKPFPENYFTLGNYHYLVKLADFEAADEPTAETLEALRETYATDLSRALQNAWLSELRSKAKITYAE